LKGDKIFDTKTEKYGFRTARVVQEPLVDQEGLTFLFEVNGIRIFCGGESVQTRLIST
jgi:beta-mannosidase